MNLVNSLAYCDQCSPPRAFGWGGFPDGMLFKHTDPKTNAVHDGQKVEIAAEECPAPGENQADFLARMMKKYVTKS